MEPSSSSVTHTSAAAVSLSAEDGGEPPSDPAIRRSRIIAVFFDAPAFTGEPFNEQEYVEAYRMLAQTIADRGSRFFVVRHARTYMGGGSFVGGWEWKDGTFRRTEDIIDADVIYSKGSTLIPARNAPVVNNKEMDRQLSDKMQIYRLFPHLCPRTILVHDAIELPAALDALRSSTVVLKPLDGWGGDGVFIGPREDIRHETLHYPLVAQEFIDTSRGIPGVTDGHHDFRMIVANGEIILTTVRVPQKGRLIANVSKGGTDFVVAPAKRPADVVALIPEIDRKLKHFGPRLYSVDCGRHSDGTWKLIELNDHPGLQPPHACNGHADAYYAAMADFLLSAVFHSQGVAQAV